MNRMTLFPSTLAAARRTVGAVKLGLATLPVLLATSQAFAQAAAGGNGIGSRLQAAATELTAGGGYVLELMGYILGGAAILLGFYTIWQHTKNPNGQSRLGYGIAGVILGGAFLSASLWGSFASNTISGGNATNTGTAQQMTFQ